MMSFQARRELLVSVRPRYRKADRKTKTTMLDEFVAATGYDRKYAIWLLGQRPRPSEEPPPRRGRRKTYGPSTQEALIWLWKFAEGLCGKRLVPLLPDLIDALQRHGQIILRPEIRQRLLSLSPATADRLLKKARTTFDYGRTLTKPGTLLRQQIPIRTFADWNEARPGFLEIDLVAHCGDTLRGEYVHTLTLTDVATGWTECVAMLGRNQITVRKAIDQARSRFPFPIKGLDTDNGAEFINATLVRYCEERRITFTRCRPYKKNDQCHVEQKNWNVVRRWIGYGRYEGQRSLAVLNALYQSLSDYQNYFQPSVRLLSKERHGATVKKTYDQARSPFRRLMAGADLKPARKEVLLAHFEKLNPAQLQSQLQAGQNRLLKLAVPRQETYWVKNGQPDSKIPY